MTSYDSVRTLFYKRIEKDEDFFKYYGLTTAEAIALAQERADTYMEEAIGRLILDCQPSVDFTARTEDNFDVDFNQQEKLIIPSLMYEMYLDRDIAYLKTINVNFTSTDLKVFDPSNARKTFMTMYDSVCEKNLYLLDTYKNTDRDTGKFLSINFSLFDDSEE